jgi:hypothetical protein
MPIPLLLLLLLLMTMGMIRCIRWTCSVASC